MCPHVVEDQSGLEKEVDVIKKKNVENNRRYKALK